MNINVKSQFGATGLVDAVNRVRVYEGPADLRHLLAPQGDSGRPRMSS